jgi:hypothetical protein
MRKGDIVWRYGVSGTAARYNGTERSEDCERWDEVKLLIAGSITKKAPFTSHEKNFKAPQINGQVLRQPRDSHRRPGSGTVIVLPMKSVHPVR